ncbi:MAG: hypothetical protein QOI42_2036, partial [Frankiaceae bacterium]|nr:hypothetical protein [Frankiaceae bacterium]
MIKRAPAVVLMLVLFTACGSGGGAKIATKSADIADQLPRASTTTTERVRPTAVTTAELTTPPTAAAVPATTTTTAARVTTTMAAAPAQQSCTLGYSPCIPPGDDVDCRGGTGNGPRYVDGPVQVDHSYGDPYGLDGDGNGV